MSTNLAVRLPALARAGALLLSLSAIACGRNEAWEPTGTAQQPLLGEQATGSIPTGMPARLTLGLAEGLGTSWMSSSGVPWDVRYQYLSKDWVTNWGHGERDGSFALQYFYDTYNKGMLPAVQFYQIVEEPGGGEDAMLSKVQNPTTMKSYFTDFKILMERAKDYGAPVVVMIEADGFGFLQIQTNGDPDKYAAIADSGLPELADLPNTVAGWGMAFLKLKQAVGADKVMLGIHISGWSSNLDVMMNNDISNIDLEVYKAYTFLSPFGLVENQTGITYDFLVGDPSDRDAGYYEKVKGMDKWWDPSPTASVDDRSFNRFAEWLRQWNVRSGKRWVLWQIPLGNSNHLNVENAGGSRQGYKDNRPEYFLGGGPENLKRYTDAGVVSLMFGPGMWGMSSYENDYFTDGQLYVKSRAKQIYDRGGLEIAPGLEWTPSDYVPNPDPTPVPTPRPPPPSDDFQAQYDWESDSALGWTSEPVRSGGLSTVDSNAFSGQRALALEFAGESGKQRFFVKSPSVPEGAEYVVFHVYVPNEHRLASVLAYVQQGPHQEYAWASGYFTAEELTPGAWNLLYVVLPEGSSPPYGEIGLEFESSRPWTGTVLLDGVGWPPVEPRSGGEASNGDATTDAQTEGGSAGGCSVSHDSGSPRSSAAYLLALGAGLYLSRRRRSGSEARSCRRGAAASARRAPLPAVR